MKDDIIKIHCVDVNPGAHIVEELNGKMAS